MKTREYNRNEAVKYAEKWAYRRNPRYYNFNELGGDCTSFASQCIYAGSKKIKQIKIKNKTTMDEEDLECLEDMIKIAIEDAYSKIDKEVEKKMGMYGSLGGLF